MIFRTEVNSDISESKIDYNTSLFFIGSCFSDNIGGKVKSFKFNTVTNPFGVLYNPTSVRNALEIIMAKDYFVESDLENHNGLWLSFYHHGSFSDVDKTIVLSKINKAIDEAHNRLKTAKFLFITFGTARVYERKGVGNVVANCHKLPENNFTRRLLPVDSIVRDYNVFLQQLKKFNPDINVVFTVSPVRHWKDGAHGNQISKSTLLLAINNIVENNTDTSYFPSYEIVIDDLRDYRFYKSDMLHPSDEAVEYIWEKFQDSFITNQTKAVIGRAQKLTNAALHRPFNPNTDQHQKFIKSALQKIEIFEKEFPLANFDEEKKLLESFLV
ncbi:MAG: GSCFA domain-containing protein [Bacteroidales bacterium]|nr:GSCFA domain-containing protein [Bacteroidales bacterium]